MNAQMMNHMVSPILATYEATKYERRPSKQQYENKTKKKQSFDSIFHTAFDDTDEDFNHETGCYGKDAKPVVRIVTSFNRIL